MDVVIACLLVLISFIGLIAITNWNFEARSLDGDRTYDGDLRY